MWRQKLGLSLLLCLLILPTFLATFVFADHSQYIKGPFPDGPSVTKECIKCHKDKAEEIISSAHWLWRGPSPDVLGAERRKDLGKINLINGF